MKRYPTSRELFVPKNSIKVIDKHSDAIAYLYQREHSPHPGAVIFYGKQTKPVLHAMYRSTERREQAIKAAFEARQERIKRKQQQQAERKAFVHDYKVALR